MGSGSGYVDGERGDDAVVTGPEGRRLDRRYRFDRFDATDPRAVEQLVALWTAEESLSREQAKARVPQAKFVAVDAEEGIVAVATAYLSDYRHLGMPLWAYRTYVAADHREGDIAFLLLHHTRDHLLGRFLSGEDTRGSGMIMEVQSEILKRARNQGIWKTTRFAFLGEDETGAHHRVFYFPGAIAPVLGGSQMGGSPA
jgi:hypothetical protein